MWFKKNIILKYFSYLVRWIIGIFNFLTLKFFYRFQLIQYFWFCLNFIFISDEERILWRILSSLRTCGGNLFNQIRDCCKIGFILYLILIRNWGCWINAQIPFGFITRWKYLKKKILLQIFKKFNWIWKFLYLVRWIIDQINQILSKSIITDFWYDIIVQEFYGRFRPITESLTIWTNLQRLVGHVKCVFGFDSCYQRGKLDQFFRPRGFNTIVPWNR